jgi:PAS domain S-box-containing protein
VVGTAADVTERIAAEAALRQSEERLRQLANTIPNLAWMADANGDITWYNDRWYDYTGSTPEEMKGWGWQRVHHPDTLPEVVRQWRESLRTGQAFEMTFPLRGRDGVFRPFFTRVAPLRDASGAIVQWFGTNTDVSSLKKAEEELREADRRKDEYLAMLAHELRNPLAPIRMAAALLKRARSDERQVARASEIIARQVGHMSGLLDDLLDVSRITRGLMSVEMERIEVAGIVAGALEQVRPLLEAKGHHVEVDQEEPHLEVMGSSLRLIQVLTNLLDNAAKYSPPQSRIEVAVRRSAGWLRIEVTDDGVGIPAELLPRVFEPFTQGERGSHRSEGGLGLGLAVVRGLVELQGGPCQRAQRRAERRQPLRDRASGGSSRSRRRCRSGGRPGGADPARKPGPPGRRRQPGRGGHRGRTSSIHGAPGAARLHGWRSTAPVAGKASMPPSSTSDCPT